MSNLNNQPRFECGVGKLSAVKPADDEVQEIVDLVNCLNLKISKKKHKLKYFFKKVERPDKY
jgi:hypothetical protein